MTAADVDDRAVLDLVRGLAGMSTVGELVPVDGGHSHRTWRARTERGDALVKVPLRDPGLARVRRHLRMHRAVWHHGAPLPAPLHVVEHSPLGRPLLVFRWLPGRDGQRAWPHLSAVERRAAAAGWGRAVATAHTLEGAAFTGCGPDMVWAEVVAARVQRLSAEHTAVGVLPAELVATTARRVLAAAERIGDLVWPIWTHLDLHLPNIVVERGHFTGLLDCEHARWWDATADVVKLRSWVFEPHPEAETPFWDGYYSTGAALPGFTERLWVCEGMEWLSGLLYWRQVGDDAMFADYWVRLTRWLG